MIKKLIALSSVVILSGCSSTMNASLACAMKGGCSNQERTALKDAYEESDRKMSARYGGRSGVPEKGFYYRLYLADGSTDCRKHDGSVDPKKFKGGNVGGKRIVRVEDYYGVLCER